jgi:hypothetical protein
VSSTPHTFPMVQLPELESLARRRAQLIARSDVYRQTLALEARTIAAETENARRWIAGARALWPLVSSLATLVSLAPRTRSNANGKGRTPLGRLGPWIARFQIARSVHALARAAWSRR